MRFITYLLIVLCFTGGAHSRYLLSDFSNELKKTSAKVEFASFKDHAQLNIYSDHFKVSIVEAGNQIRYFSIQSFYNNYSTHMWLDNLTQQQLEEPAKASEKEQYSESIKYFSSLILKKLDTSNLSILTKNTIRKELKKLIPGAKTSISCKSLLTR